MTYSIVARDAETGELGVAVQSHWFSVGSVVPWAEAGVGAVATQAFADPSYGPLGLALMRGGRDAAAALRALLATDGEREQRQVAMVDGSGGVAVHTGSRCIEAAGHAAGEGVCAQANMMRRPTVWAAMLEAYRSAAGPLAERPLAALDAGEAEGGDVRGRQSAALLVVAGTATGRPWDDRLVDLRVEDSADPLGELRRLLRLRRAYGVMDDAEQRLTGGDPVGALQGYATAHELAPDNDEVTFWLALVRALAGDTAMARALLDGLRAREPGWGDLLRRLPAAGLFPDNEGLVRRLLGEDAAG